MQISVSSPSAVLSLHRPKRPQAPESEKKMYVPCNSSVYRDRSCDNVQRQLKEEIEPEHDEIMTVKVS